MPNPEPLDINVNADAVLIVGQRSDNKFIPVRLPDTGLLVASEGGGGGGPVVDEELDARIPVQYEIVVPASGQSAVDLGAVATESSAGGWDIAVADGQADILLGEAPSPKRRVKADAPFFVPSTTLTGWYVVSTGAASLVVATGAVSS